MVVAAPTAAHTLHVSRVCAPCCSYARGWTGAFVKPEHETAYRLRAWKYSMPTRRAGIVFLAIAALIHVVVVVAGFVKHKDTEGRIGDQAPSIACTVVGLGLLTLGWKRDPRFAAWWDYIGSAAIALLASPMIAMYAAWRRSCVAW